MHPSPITTSEASESSTAPNMILAPGPTFTSPTRVAVGATYAVGSTDGSVPWCLISMLAIVHRDHLRPGGDGNGGATCGRGQASADARDHIECRVQPGAILDEPDALVAERRVRGQRAAEARAEQRHQGAGHRVPAGADGQQAEQE